LARVGQEATALAGALARKVADVVRSHPEDATIGATMPLLDDTYMPDPPNSYLLSPQVFADAEKGKLYNF
jgi:hypothetical protein